MFDNDGPWKNDTIEEINLSGGEPSEYEEVEDENDLCDCDPQYKESQTVQQSAGANLGGFGGQVSDGTTVIVCTKCGDRFYEDKEETRGGNGFDPMM
ncbi:MAG: hypothetical protein ACI9TI_002597 [Natronomonas sp.]|jgi:hypothetical protein|uniref:hypothetical protein n=1 Tax=Natronomonas sp. TaxID=2184060 RepID=UPI0039892F60